jgi:hypothetical protein
LKWIFDLGRTNCEYLIYLIVGYINIINDINKIFLKNSENGIPKIKMNKIQLSI